MRPRTRWTTWALLATVLAIQCFLLLWHHGQSDTQPHEVPVVVQGPPVLAQSVGKRLNDLPDDPVKALVVYEDADPRRGLRTGDAVAALVMDLGKPTDVLYVSSVNDPEMTRLAEQVAARVDKPMERTFVTREVTPRGHADLSLRTLALVTASWISGGFLLAVIWVLVGRRRRTTPGPDLRAALLLVAACGGLSLVVATVMAMSHGSFGTWWVVGFLSSYAAAIATRAFEVLFGLVGVALASTLVVFLVGPFLSGRDPRLLPGRWWEVAPWTLHGATQELAGSVLWFGRAGALRPTLVLVGVIAISLLVVLVAPRLRSQKPEDVAVARVPWRLRTVVIVVPVAMAIVAATALAPSVASVVTADPVPGASQTKCVKTPKISTLKELNDFAGKVRGGPAFQGADVGADVLLQDGRRLWVFADTLRSEDFDGQRFVRNSMLVLGKGCTEAVIPADKGALIPDRGDEVGYWPMSIARVERPGYDIVGVATQRVRSTGGPDGAFAFESLGPSIAVFVVPRGKTPQLVAKQDVGRDDKDTNRPEWGAASAVVGDWVYLYGTARPQKTGVFGFSLQVARTRPEKLLDTSSWQYWDGGRWQGSAKRAKVLIPAENGVSQTLSVFPRNGRWWAVSKRNEFLGTDLVAWSAPAPTGPFDSGTTLAKLPSDPKGGELRYMPLAHPDLVLDKKSLIVSYSRNNTDTDKVEDNPFLYRPQFLEVRLPDAR